MNQCTGQWGDVRAQGRRQAAQHAAFLCAQAQVPGTTVAMPGTILFFVAMLKCQVRRLLCLALPLWTQRLGATHPEVLGTMRQGS